LCDIDLGLGGLEAYDWTSLSQPSQIKEYDSVDHSDDDDADSDAPSSDDDTKSDANYEEGEINEEDEEDDGDVCLTNEEYDNVSEDSNLADIPVDVNVPQLPLDAFYMDNDGKEIKNPFSRKYRTGQMWAKNRDGKITFAIGDIFVDKKKRRKVVEEYAV